MVISVLRARAADVTNKGYVVKECTRWRSVICYYLTDLLYLFISLFHFFFILSRLYASFPSFICPFYEDRGRIGDL